MKDSDYLRTVADVIDAVRDSTPDPLGDGETQARLRDIADRIERLEARPTKKEIEAEYVLVPWSTTMANLANGMDIAYHEVSVETYHQALAAVAQLRTKVWAAIAAARADIHVPWRDLPDGTEARAAADTAS